MFINTSGDVLERTHAESIPGGLTDTAVLDHLMIWTLTPDQTVCWHFRWPRGSMRQVSF